jgi:hypothetical protein
MKKKAAACLTRSSKSERSPGSRAKARAAGPDVAGPDAAKPPDEALSFYVQVDGRRMSIEACDELELRCGEASITLRRNGKVVVRGTYIETCSRGTNRIKGSTVKLN